MGGGGRGRDGFRSCEGMTRGEQGLTQSQACGHGQDGFGSGQGRPREESVMGVVTGWLGRGRTWLGRGREQPRVAAGALRNGVGHGMTQPRPPQPHAVV